MSEQEIESGRELKVDPETKHEMAKIIVQDAIPKAGVRSIEKLVQGRMGNRLLHSLLLTHPARL